MLMPPLRRAIAPVADDFDAADADVSAVFAAADGAAMSPPPHEPLT